MRTIKRRGLAVCMAALLVTHGLTAVAAELPRTEAGDLVENVAAVSGSDVGTDGEMTGETEDTGEGNPADVVESVSGDQIMLLAADDIASGTDGNITWVIDAGGKLTVNGTGDLSGDHAGGDFAWVPYCEQITSAELHVTGMTDASRLFSDCRNMTSIDLSGFDTGSVINMCAMFSGCSSLADLDVSHFDTSHVTDMGAMFYGCSSLTSLDVSHFDTGNVVSMMGGVVLFRQDNTIYFVNRGMFEGCSSLTDLDVSGFSTSNVTDMYRMFKECKNLSSLNVSGFDTSNVTDMSSMFEGCKNLSSLDVSGFDTSNVTDMSSMFEGCKNLPSLDVSGFATSNAADMSYMFSGCNGLINLDVSGFDTSKVENMAYMFDGCSNLVDLDVSGFNTCAVTGMESMFALCSSLSVIDVSKFDTKNVTNMAYMFASCSDLTNLDVSGFNTDNVTDMEAMFLDCSGLNNLNIKNFNTGNVVDMAYMFSECNGLTSLEVVNFVTGNVRSMTGMFAGCDNLVDLDIKNFDTSNVTDMGGMFSHCSSLIRLDLSNFNTIKVVNMSGFVKTSITIIEGGTGFSGRWSGMFTGCSSLEYLDVSSFDTSNVTQMYWMFQNCSSLKNLDLSGFDFSCVADGLEDMFSGCRNLTLLESPRNINCSVLTPAVRGTSWHLPDGTEVTELPQGLDYSVTLTRSGTPSAPQITTTTPDLNMEDVIRVKYVPYSYTVETDADETDTVEFSIEEGRLADGLQLYPATGEIYGVPLETGSFPITVKATYSNPAYSPSYAQLTLTVLDNTDANVGVATDIGYDIIQPVTGFDTENMEGSSTQTLVSQGEYSQFRDVYIDGRRLTAEQDYTSEAGSTRITILNQTLAGGGEGTHTLGIEFRTEDGTLKRAAQNYIIGKNVADDNAGGDNGGSGGNDNNSDSSNNNNGSNDNNSNNDSLLPTAVSSQQDFIIYTVERGDSLWKIAEKFYGQGSSWRRIYEDNRAVIRNPGRLYAGQKLVIRLTGLTNLTPDASVPISGAAVSEGTAYRVQKGDRLWTIAHRAYGSGRLWYIIYEANKDIIADPERIREGQVITIPLR